MKRYSMGRCLSCGDANTEEPWEDTDGTWVKYEDVIAALATKSCEGCVNQIEGNPICQGCERMYLNYYTPKEPRDAA